jgi:hypothetical protein
MHGGNLKLLDQYSKNNHISNFMKIRPVGAELFYSDRQQTWRCLMAVFVILRRRRKSVSHLRLNSSNIWKKSRKQRSERDSVLVYTYISSLVLLQFVHFLARFSYLYPLSLNRNLLGKQAVFLLWARALRVNATVVTPWLLLVFYSNVQR